MGCRQSCLDLCYTVLNRASPYGLTIDGCKGVLISDGRMFPCWCFMSVRFL